MTTTPAKAKFDINSASQTPTADIGPATPSPRWCPPDTQAEWGQLKDGAPVCTWTRNVPESDPYADVWIWCEDRIVNGRVVRTAPRIGYTEPTAAGIDGPAALALARKLVQASDIIAEEAAL